MAPQVDKALTSPFPLTTLHKGVRFKHRPIKVMAQGKDISGDCVEGIEGQWYMALSRGSTGKALMCANCHKDLAVHIIEDHTLRFIQKNAKHRKNKI